MTDADLAQLVRTVVREELAAFQPQAQTRKVIVSRAEAMKHVGITSHAGFSAWCARWHYRPERRNRHSIPRLDLAMAREAGTAHVPANLRK